MCYLIRRNAFPAMIIACISAYAVLRDIVIPFPPWSHVVAQFALPIQLFSYATGVFLYWLTMTFPALHRMGNTPWMIFFAGGTGVILTQGDIPTVTSLFLLSCIARCARPLSENANRGDISP